MLSIFVRRDVLGVGPPARLAGMASMANSDVDDYSHYQSNHQWKSRRNCEWPVGCWIHGRRRSPLCCTGLKQGICNIVIATSATYWAISYHRSIWISLSTGHGEGRTEGNGVVSTCTSESASGIIVGVTVGSGALCLEELRVSTRFAGIGITICPTAAICRISKGLTGALAGHNATSSNTIIDLELLRAAEIDIRDATCWGASTSAPLSCDQQRKIVAINKAHVIEILGLALPNWELCKGSGRYRPCTIAFKGTATVSSGAVSLTSRIKGATGSSPETPGPTWRYVNGLCLAWKKLETGGRQGSCACIREKPRPHVEFAIVCNNERWCRSSV